MEYVLTVIADVFKCVDIPIVNIKKCTSRKFHGPVGASIPFFYGGIKLV